MKKAFLLLCAVLLVLGSVLPLAGYRLAETVWGRSVLPLAGYRLAETVWGRRAAAPPSPPPESAEPAAPEPVPDSAPAPSTSDAETFLLTNAATGEVFSLSGLLRRFGAAEPLHRPLPRRKAPSLPPRNQCRTAPLRPAHPMQRPFC